MAGSSRWAAIALSMPSTTAETVPAASAPGRPPGGIESSTLAAGTTAFTGITITRSVPRACTSPRSAAARDAAAAIAVARAAILNLGLPARDAREGDRKAGGGQPELLDDVSGHHT